MVHPQYVRTGRFWLGGVGLHVALADEMRLRCKLLLNGMQAILALAKRATGKIDPARRIPSHSAVATASRYPSSVLVVRVP